MESTAPLLNDNNALTEGENRVRFDDQARISLTRRVFSKPLEINGKRNDKEPSSVVRSIPKNLANAASKHCNAQSFLSLFAVLNWLPKYKWKKDLMADLLAGLTVGVMSIPQGMAYAKLGGMPPVYGLYTNIIPTIVYFVFGTGKLGAIGPATVLCLITSSIRFKYIPCQDCWQDKLSNVTNSSYEIIDENGTIAIDDNTVDADANMLEPIDIGSALAFLVGVFLLLMGLFRLSFIADYLPDQLVGGFTVAAAMQVFTGQLPSIFGIKLPTRHGIGKVVMNYYDLFSLITETNVGTLITFFICFLFLLTSKKLINPMVQKKFKVPFPAEFIVMVVATLVSYYAQLQPRFGVSTVRHIPAGLPVPRLPKFSLMESLLVDSLLLAVVTYSHCISLAKVFAKRNGYRVHTAHEFYAYGFMNMISSFFQCFNSGQSVARSFVYEMAGARSQLCGMIGAVVVIFTVLFIAPFLASLPNAVLAAVIVTACVEMFHNLTQLPALFRKNKYDFSIFLLTLLSVVLLDVTFGLAVSVTFAMVTVILRSQRAVLEQADDQARIMYTSDFAGKLKQNPHLDTEDRDFWDRIRVWKLTSSVFYINAERVKTTLLATSNNNHSGLAISEDDVIETEMSVISRNESSLSNGFAGKIAKMNSSGKPSLIILDASVVSFTDIMGINALKEVSDELKKQGTLLFICGCTTSVEKQMKRVGFPDDSNAFVFPTVLDGVFYARYYFQTGITPDYEQEITKQA